MRNKESCPCLAVYSKKPSSELKSLCITAIEGQMKALREAEGEDSRLLEDLRSTLATVNVLSYNNDLCYIHAFSSDLYCLY